MSKPETFRFGQLFLEVSNGDSPETWSSPCGLTSKGFKTAAQTSDTAVPDCTDPDAPAWLDRAVTTLSRDISGDGVLAGEFQKTWDEWISSGETRRVRVKIGDRQWIGDYLLTTFDQTGTIGEKIKVNVAMMSDGEVPGSTVSDGIP